MTSITVHSKSLEELDVAHGNRWTGRAHISVDVDSPVLKQLTTSFHSWGSIKVSILAPMVEKVCWRCSYAKPVNPVNRLGPWGLSEVGLYALQETNGQTNSGRDACVQLPSAHVLSLHISRVHVQDSVILPNAELSFAAEIDKHVVTNFSGLDLHLSTKGHVFGAFVLHLLGMHWIRTALRNLKIVLLRSEMNDACPVNCLCAEPKDWIPKPALKREGKKPLKRNGKKKTNPLSDLENVVIEGAGGERHELNFLKEVFRFSPKLKKMTVRLSDGITLKCWLVHRNKQHLQGESFCRMQR